MVHRDDLSVSWGGEDEAGECGQEELSQVGTMWVGLGLDGSILRWKAR
jgi:hypothetical protein